MSNRVQVEPRSRLKIDSKKENKRTESLRIIWWRQVQVGSALITESPGKRLGEPEYGLASHVQIVDNQSITCDVKWLISSRVDAEYRHSSVMVDTNDAPKRIAWSVCRL